MKPSVLTGWVGTLTPGYPALEWRWGTFCPFFLWRLGRNRMYSSNRCPWDSWLEVTKLQFELKLLFNMQQLAGFFKVGNLSFSFGGGLSSCLPSFWLMHCIFRGSQRTDAPAQLAVLGVVLLLAASLMDVLAVNAQQRTGSREGPGGTVGWDPGLQPFFGRSP